MIALLDLRVRQRRGLDEIEKFSGAVALTDEPAAVGAFVGKLGLSGFVIDAAIFLGILPDRYADAADLDAQRGSGLRCGLWGCVCG